MIDIVEYLTEKNLNPRPAGDGNVRCLCPFHEEQEGKPGRLYIQTDDEDRWGLLFCLAGETRVITKEGTFEIKDLVGTSPELLVAKNGPSTWKHAPIKSFGKQKLMAVNLSRNGIKKTIRATPEHRWFVKAGKKHDKRRELTTAELKPRHRLCESRAQSVADMGVDISHHGIVRGFIYGDGTMPNNTTGSVAYFYGAKDLALTSYFPSQKLVPQGPDCVAMRSFPAFYKAERPALTENKAYLYGWLAGYFAADGCYTATCDTPILHSANREDLEYVRDLCNVLGIGTYGIGEQTRRGFGKEDSEIYNVRFSVKNLSEDFFIIESHKERFKASTKYDRLGWVVESIEDLDIEEEVYCAVVENYGNFTLEDNILTGNCFVCGARGSINKLRKFYGDSTVDFTPLESANPIIEVAAQYYSERLFDNIDQYLYLEDRGLEEATIVQARLGYADGNLGAHLLQRGYTPEEIKETGLIRKDGSDYFKDEIIFPCLQYGRAMQLRGKKTQGMKGVPTILYNSDSIIGEDTVYICEGEMDTLTLQQMGFNTIGVPGVHNWKDEWTEEIDEAKRVYIVFDQDKAGISGAEKTASKLGSKSRIVKLPAKGIDVNDWYVKFGKRREDFEWLFSQAKGGLLVSVAQAYDKWTQIEGNADLVGLRFNISALDKPMSYGQLPGQVVVTLARTDAGKGHPYNTEIQTPKGLRLWGDLKIGDEVFGSNGQPTKVKALHERGMLSTYRVSFSDGTSVECDGDHIWSVHKDTWNRNRFDFRNRTTSELINDGLYKFKSNGRMFYKYNIQMSAPVDYEKKNLPIPPYTMGALLSNGYLGGCGTEFRTPDPEVAERVAEEGSDLRDRVTKPEVCDNYGVAGVRHLTRSLGIDVGSSDKFIPTEYLEASLAQRIDLLQGLFDGDGGNSSRPGMQVHYYTTSIPLALSVRQLIQSFGGTATMSTLERVGQNGKPYKDICVTCMIPEEISPFSTHRKNVEKTYTNKHLPRRAITNIEYVGEKEIRCITVEAADCLYLIGREYILTHNSIDAINKMVRNRLADDNFKCLFISLEQTRNEVFERLYRIHNFYFPGSSVFDVMEYWKNNLLIVDKNRISEGELIDCIEQHAYEAGSPANKIIVDYLGYYARSFTGNAKERTSEAIMGLKRIAKEFDTVIETPVQANRTGEIGESMSFDMAADAAEVEHTANIMMALWRPEQKLQKDPDNSDVKPGDVYTQIIKSKNGGSGAIARYHFAPLTLAMVPYDDPLYDLAIKERSYAVAGDTWLEATKRRLSLDMSI